MIDPSITDVDFGRDYLGGKGKQTARRVIQEDRIPCLKNRGHWTIKRSDAEAWRDARMQTPEQPTLKSLLRDISARVLAKRPT